MRRFAGVWRLPAIVARLAADHVLLFWFKRPATKVAADICRDRAGDDFHPPVGSELRSATEIYQLSTYLLHYGFSTSKPCLRRSLLLLRWCRKRRVEAKMVIGVDKSGSDLEGHSWIEFEGRPFMEPAEFLRRYTPMLKIRSRAGLETSDKMKDCGL